MKPTRIIEKNIDLWDQVPQFAKRHPWYSPVTTTPELEELANKIDAGGTNLIKEIEG